MSTSKRETVTRLPGLLGSQLTLDISFCKHFRGQIALFRGSGLALVLCVPLRSF